MIFYIIITAIVIRLGWNLDDYIWSDWIMKDDYRDIYFFLILGIVSFVIILAVGIYIEVLPYL